jgi:hypothetical protein
MSDKTTTIAIVNWLFNNRLNYRENVLFHAAKTKKINTDIYCQAQTHCLEQNLFRTKGCLIKNGVALGFSFKWIFKKYDIVFLHDLFQIYTVIPLFIFIVKRTKIVYEHEQRFVGDAKLSHFVTSILIAPIVKVILKHVDIIRVPNKLSYDFLLKLNPRLTNIHQVPLAIDNSVFKFEPRSETRQKITLGWSGARPKDKNIQIIIELIKRFSGKQYQWKIVTDTPEFFCKVENVEFLPLLAQRDLADYFRSVDIMFWTTPTQSYFEAAACGTLVAVPACGVPDCIHEYTNCIVPLEIDCDNKGLAKISAANIDAFARVVVDFDNCRENSTTPYSFSGTQYLQFILNKLALE